MFSFTGVQFSLVKNLNPLVLAQLYHLTLGAEGQMSSLLASKKDAEVFYIEDEQGKVVSWGMVHKSLFFNKFTVNLFTAFPHRNKGLASRILSTIKRKHENLYGAYESSNIFMLHGCKNVGF